MDLVNFMDKESMTRDQQLSMMVGYHQSNENSWKVHNWYLQYQGSLRMNCKNGGLCEFSFTTKNTMDLEWEFDSIVEVEKCNNCDNTRISKYTLEGNYD